MLTVKAYVATSAIQGVGLFATDPIPSGTKMWYRNPVLDCTFSDQMYGDLSAIEKEYFSTYYVKCEKGWMIVGDNARFVNHSRDPNMIHIDGYDYAARDISAGEEITYDYRIFEHDPILDQPWI